MKKVNKERLMVGMTSLFQLVILLISFIKPEKLVPLEYVEQLKSMSGFGIFIMIIIYAILLWDEIKYTKKRLIVGEVILFLTFPNIFVRIVCIINILLLAFIKYERKEKLNIAEVREKLSVESIKCSTVKWLGLVLLLLIYFGQNFIKTEWLEMLSPLGLISFFVGIYLVLFILALITFFKEIKLGAKKIFKNFRLSIRYMINLFLKMVLAMLIASNITAVLTEKNISVNQEAIESMPLYMTIPLAVIWAPLVEEVVFRGAFKKIIKFNGTFIVVSAFVFGFFHAIGEATLGIALATSLPYAVIGAIFAYSYTKTNNLALNILLHMLYNLLAVFTNALG